MNRKLAENGQQIDSNQLHTNKEIILVNKRCNPLVLGTSRFAATKNDDGTMLPTHFRDNEEISLIKDALRQGINIIDTAHAYGDSEIIVAAGIDGYPREKVVVVTKVGFKPVASSDLYHEIESSRHRLNTEPDIILIHNRHDQIQDGDLNTWIYVMNQAVDEGLTKAIGISNFRPTELKKAIKLSRHPIAVYQAKVNLVRPRMDFNELKAICLDNNITFMASSSLNRGDIPTSISKHLSAIIAKYNINPQQISLITLMQLNLLPIFQTHNLHHLMENITTLNLKIEPKDKNILINEFYDILQKTAKT